MFRVEDRPVPAPSRDEILIRVEGAGVNRADVLQREGRYPPLPGTPDWPGLEVAGVVEGVGPHVDAWESGDEVCALLPSGGYAEYAVAQVGLVLPRPPRVSWEEAASLVEAVCTVWSNLREAGARPGESVLIHGGSGGVGTIATQVAASHGMRVLTTARGPERAARCLTLGADVAIDYVEEDFVEVAAREGGVDVILDVLGGLYLERNLEALAPGGRLVVIGLQGGAHAPLDLGVLLAKRARIIGTTLRARPVAQKASIVADVRENIWPRIPTEIHPVIAAAFPLRDAAAAHVLMESGEAFGKIVLTTRPEGAAEG